MMSAVDDRPQATRAAVIVEGLAERDGHGLVLDVRARIERDPNWAVTQVLDALGYVPQHPEAWLRINDEDGRFPTGLPGGR